MADKDDWMYEDEPGITGPPPRLMNRGPDAMRPGASPDAGTGNPFIFLPNNKIVWGRGVGHESMLDTKNPDFLPLVRAVFPDDAAFEAFKEKTSYQGEPFVESDAVRWELQKRCLFGRLGKVAGHDLLALWPGTEGMATLLPALIDYLVKTGQANEATKVSVGRSMKYTIGHFLRRQSEVLSQLKKASDEGKKASSQLPPVPSSQTIRRTREADKLNAAAGRGFAYAYRYGESFREFFKRGEGNA